MVGQTGGLFDKPAQALQPMLKPQKDLFGAK
jgi:hypothetical protein